MTMRLHLRKELILFIALCVGFAVLPFFVSGDAVLMQLLILCLIYAIVATAWDLVMGVAGLFTFGQIAFMAAGAYASAIISMRLGVSPWLSLIVAGAITAVVGLVVGLLCLRLEGDYVALLTFAIQLLMAPFIISAWGKWVGTGGNEGLYGIPPYAIGGFRFTPLDYSPWLYAALGLFIVCMVITYKAIYSNWGRAFVALRDSPKFAKGLGINEFKYKLLVFALSATLTGFAGAFYAHYTGVLSVRLINGLDLFLMLLVMQVVGGMGRFPGAAVGAVVITFINQWLSFADSYRSMVFGAAIVLLVIFFPQGILGAIWPDDRSSSGLGGLGKRIQAKVPKRKPKGGAVGDTVPPKGEEAAT